MFGRQDAPGAGDKTVSVVLIAPDEEFRRAIVKAVSAARARVIRESPEYPHADAIATLFSSGCDIVIVELDSGIQEGLETIEAISRSGIPATIMAISSRNEADVVIRAMRAGAREFLNSPISESTLADAIERASARLRAGSAARSPGKLCVFQGAKGGAGVTTLATNFAVALAGESAGKVVLVDMHHQLGEAALSLGLTAQFSIGDALGNAVRLDAEFLSSLLVKHASGLMVLASPDAYGLHRSLERGAEKLLQVLREEFAFVIVDAGPCCTSLPDALFEAADTIYLVTEMNLPALRNARRLLTWFSDKELRAGIEVVLNRFNSRRVEIDEGSAVSALSRPVDWKVPSDYVAVRSAQNLGVPLANQETTIARVIRQMARSASGNPEARSGKTAPAAGTGEKWKFWTSSNTRPLSTAHS